MIDRKTAYTWSVAGVAATCYTIDGYDNAVFNALQGSAAWMDWAGNPSPAMLGNLHTVYSLTAIFAGFVLAGPLSKYNGRRIPMLAAALLVVVATLFQLFQPRGNIGYYYAGRIFAAFAQGIVVPIAPTYIAEIAPAASRGKLMLLWQLNCSLGQFSCFAMSTMTQHRRKELPPQWDWRIVVLQQLAGPLVILLFVPFIPESPRWLVQRNKLEKAKAVMLKFRKDEEEATKEVQQIVESIEKEKRTSTTGAYKPLWTDKSLRRRFFIASGLFAGQQLCGQGSLNNYSTMVYKKVFSDSATIQLINAINALIAILATFLTLMSDRIGRRPLIIAGSFGMCLLLICAATLHVASPTLPNGTKSHGIGAGIVTTFYLFVIHYKPSWGATTWILASEMFSLNVRAHAVGMSSQAQNALNVVIGQIFPIIFARIHFRIFYIFASLTALMCVNAYFFLPETKGLSLEEMGRAFGGIDKQSTDDLDTGTPLDGAEESFEKGEKAKTSQENDCASRDAVITVPELPHRHSTGLRLDLTNAILRILNGGESVNDAERHQRAQLGSTGGT